MKYYKVEFSETYPDDKTEVYCQEDDTYVCEEETVTYKKVFGANSAKKLEEQINAYKDSVDGYAAIQEIGRKQVSVQELINDELRELYELIFRKYLRMKLNPKKLNAQKYAELKEKYLNNPQSFYEMLRYENKSLNVEEYLGRYNKHFKKNMQDISAKQFFDRVRVLSEGDPDRIGD
ncbi:MAG: hypothetical protein HFE47_04610 [Clostridia bacterium]|nr:hypothetical protein [Clostridia bacterium]